MRGFAHLPLECALPQLLVKVVSKPVCLKTAGLFGRNSEVGRGWFRQETCDPWRAEVCRAVGVEGKTQPTTTVTVSGNG